VNKERLASAIDPLTRPAARVTERLLFVVEAVEDVELIAHRFARAAVALEQEIRCERSVRQTMRRRENFIAVVYLDV
jgi:hypothetical protein